jgi:hypothetical protein
MEEVTILYRIQIVVDKALPNLEFAAVQASIKVGSTLPGNPR